MSCNAHDFELRNGVWWCVTENVVSNACSDDSRCDSERCCNGSPDVPHMLVVRYDCEYAVYGPFDSFNAAYQVAWAWEPTLWNVDEVSWHVVPIDTPNTFTNHMHDFCLGADISIVKGDADVSS